MRADMALRLAKQANPGRRSMGLSDVRGYASYGRFGDGVAATVGSSADAGAALTVMPATQGSSADAMATSDSGLLSVNADTSQPSVTPVIDPASGNVVAAVDQSGNVVDPGTGAVLIPAPAPARTLASLSLAEALMFSTGVSIVSHLAISWLFGRRSSSPTP